MSFPVENVGFIDFETRGPVSIKTVGAYRYVLTSWPIMLAFALGGEPVEIIETANLDVGLTWADMPDEFMDFHARVERGEAVWCAHNAAFDKAVWNSAPGFPKLEAWMIIDTMAQIAASGLPGALDQAAKRAGTARKDSAGKKLIELFSMVGSRATIATHPDEWLMFGDYCANDVEAMRDLFLSTAQLSLREWQEYWSAERVNERGVMIDIPLCLQATKLATVDRDHCDAALIRLTGGLVGAVTQVQRMTKWLDANLDPGGRAILTLESEEDGEEDEDDENESKQSLARDRIDLLLAYLADKPELDACRRVLEIRKFGGSTTPAKFKRMVDQQVGGALFGQYVFNGAAQTGRFSSRGGPQLHNLMRTALDYELDAIDALLSGCSHAQLAALGGDGLPVARKLSMLIRPAIIARPGKVLVWSDLSQIEARVLPWLAKSDAADKRLQIFRDVDADPTLPDLYTVSAAEMMGIEPAAVDKPTRQRGKVSELALGFGGAENALQRMAANYGIRFDDDVARDLVARWRKANPWARRFWGAHNADESYGLWGAFNRALEQPETIQTAGRINYVCISYLGGWTVFCELPSGRLLCYRNVRTVTIETKGRDGLVSRRSQLVFDRGFGTMKLWHGILAENVTQAVAADILRGTIARLDDDPALDWMPVVIHTHDEIVTEPDFEDAERARSELAAAMRAGFSWSTDLPINSDESTAFHYSKTENKTVVW